MAELAVEAVRLSCELVAAARELVGGGLQVLSGVVELGCDVLVEVLDLELGRPRGTPPRPR